MQRNNNKSSTSSFRFNKQNSMIRDKDRKNKNIREKSNYKNK